jgi:hypothetical protein
MAKTNLTADGSTIDYTIEKRLVNFSGKGTFGGGTVTINEVQADTTVTVVASFTADFHTSLELPKSSIYRMTLAGATTPNIDLYFVD